MSNTRCIVVVLALLTSCGDNIVPADAGSVAVDAVDDAHPYGWSPEIKKCCDWFTNPITNDKPQTCLNKHTDINELQETQCRYLHCIGNLFTYWACRCNGKLSEDKCS